MALRVQWGSRRYTKPQPTCHLCIIHIVAPVAHWGPGTLKMARCTWCWYAVAPGAHWGCNVQKWLDRHVVHLVASTAHWGPRTPAKTIDLPVVHTVAPAAHWGPRTDKMARSTWHWYIKWLPGLTEVPQWQELSISTSMFYSYSGSCGSLGTQNS